MHEDGGRRAGRRGPGRNDQNLNAQTMQQVNQACGMRRPLHGSYNAQQHNQWDAEQAGGTGHFQVYCFSCGGTGTLKGASKTEGKG